MTQLGLRLARLAATQQNQLTSDALALGTRLLAAHVAQGGTYCDTSFYPTTAAGDKNDVAAAQRFMAGVLSAFAKQDEAAFGALALAHTFEAEALIGQGCALLDQTLDALGVSKLAYVLVAGVNAHTWPELRATGVLGQLAQDERVGALVLDWLDLPPLLDTVLDEAPEFSYVQLHYDPVAWDDKGLRLRESYMSCWSHERKVIATQPLRGGYLADPPEAVAAEFAKAGAPAEPAYWALRFAADEPQVEIVSVATSSLEHFELSARALEVDELLTLAERNACLRAGRAVRDMKEIDCIGCRRCVGACPNQIPIPQLFSLYNQHIRVPEDPDPAHMYAAYARKGNVASACDNNRRCIPVCPKAIQIPDMLKLVAHTFGEC